MSTEPSAYLKSAEDDATRRETFAKGSLTFFFASKFLNRDCAYAIAALYAWCRYSDDQIDNAPSDAVRTDRLLKLRQKTKDALVHHKSDSVVFRGLVYIERRYKVPHEYFYHLLDGMEYDSQFEPFESIRELENYCYQVASTVGLIACYIFPVQDLNSLKHARSLGIAMQLTNISRDIVEDHNMGRRYIPTIWLRSENIDPAKYVPWRFAAQTRRFTKKLLEIADRHYRHSELGIKDLPFRAALGVMTARYIYAEIGEQITSGKVDFLQTRSVVPFHRKAVLAVKSILKVIVIKLKLYKPQFSDRLIRGESR